MSINGQGHSLTLVKGHSDFKVKCLTFGLYTQVSDSGSLGPLVFYTSDVSDVKLMLNSRLAGGHLYGCVFNGVFLCLPFFPLDVSDDIRD